MMTGSGNSPTRYGHAYRDEGKGQGEGSVVLNSLWLWDVRTLTLVF